MSHSSSKSPFHKPHTHPLGHHHPASRRRKRFHSRSSRMWTCQSRPLRRRKMGPTVSGHLQWVLCGGSSRGGTRGIGASSGADVRGSTMTRARGRIAARRTMGTAPSHARHPTTTPSTSLGPPHHSLTCHIDCSGTSLSSHILLWDKSHQHTHPQLRPSTLQRLARGHLHLPRSAVHLHGAA